MTISLKKIYDTSPPIIQSFIDRFRYATGFLPRICNFSETLFKISKPGRAILIISADFELSWAWNKARIFKSRRTVHARQLAERARKNIPLLLDLFDEYDIPITWATVGHLFLSDCRKIDGMPHPDLPRLPYFKNEFWEYKHGDWFDDDPCCNAADAPAWYAPDLIEVILKRKTKHEIACHTFSHIDCSDENCTSEVLDKELAACQRLASHFGLTLKSFVFPGNICGNFAVLKQRGFSSYRWHDGYELGIPERDGYGLWRIPGGITWEKPEKWPIKSWLKAVERMIIKAIDTGTVCHLWFHPSCETVNLEHIFPSTLEIVKKHEKDITVSTMSNYTSWLEENSYHQI